MSLEWQEDLATGIETIDAQHKGIFARFEALNTACDGGCAKEELINLMGFLEDYAREHFRDEEKALLEAAYPDLSVQQENHQIFLREIAALKRKIDESEPGMAEIMETKRLLIRWLIQHIRQMDMAFVDFLKGDVRPAQGRNK